MEKWIGPQPLLDVKERIIGQELETIHPYGLNNRHGKNLDQRDDNDAVCKVFGKKRKNTINIGKSWMQQSAMGGKWSHCVLKSEPEDTLMTNGTIWREL